MTVFSWNGKSYDTSYLSTVPYAYLTPTLSGVGNTSPWIFAALEDALAQVNLNVIGSSAGLVATSTTSATIGTGPQTLTVNAGKQFVAGMFVNAYSTASPANYMIGQVTSYDSGTGVLAFTVLAGDTGGSGTFAAWTVTQSGRKGSTGAAATIAVGAVTTGAPGSSVSVVNSGTSGAAVFDITIPRGDVGPTGAGSTVFTAVNGVSTGTARATQNLITTPTGGINISATDNPGASRTDITVTTNFLSAKNHFLMSRN